MAGENRHGATPWTPRTRPSQGCRCGAHGRVEVFDSREKVLGPAPFAWITEAVTGSPRVLANGEVLEIDRDGIRVVDQVDAIPVPAGSDGLPLEAGEPG